MPIGPILRAMKHNRTRFGLIVLEIAITLAIVTNCVNMILDERSKMLRRSGFDDENLITVGFTPFGKEFEEQPYVDGIVQSDVRALQALPGVKSVAVTYMTPWIGGGSSGTFTADGYPEKFQAQAYPVAEDFIDALGAKLVAGRKFTPQDQPADPGAAPTVTIITEALAKKLWGDANPIGKVMKSSSGDSPRTVVGVIGEFYNPYAWNIGEYARFSPIRWWDGNGARYLIRTEPGAVKAVVPQIEPRLVTINGSRTFNLQSIAEIKDNFFSSGRLVITAMTAVIIVLVFVTALGIVGITSLSVAERTKQIGTRRALGATRGDILKHFLTENWIVTTIGLVLGVFATYALNYFLVSELTDVKMPWYLVGVGMVLLWLNGLAATIPPAVRAARVAPAIATRSV